MNQRKNQRKKTLIWALLLLAVVFFLFFVSYFVRQYSEKRANSSLIEAYSINWGLRLPKKLAVIKNFTTEHGFQGDGNRFTIFQADNSFGNSLIGAVQGKSDEAEAFALRIAKVTEVAEDYLPDFDKPYAWKMHTAHETDSLLVLFFPEEHKLYFIEELF